MTRRERAGARLVVVLGPTGTGKSKLALELARRLGGEIVGCDAIQVYRDLDAATAKPGDGERQAVVHHLIDCVDPRTDYTMADYAREAERAIAGIFSRNRVPIVAGGSGLYLRGLLRGYVEAPARDAPLRRRLRRIVARGGAERLRAWLGRRDPGAAARIPATDVQRLIRAVELVLLGGRSWSERLSEQGSWSGGEDRYPSLKIGLDMDRARHRELLDRRVDDFFDAGLVDEVRRLLLEGVPREANALKAIGYREVFHAIRTGGDPRAVRDEVRRNTRRFAKRQRTWFRREPSVTWLEADRPATELADRVVELWRGADTATLR